MSDGDLPQVPAAAFKAWPPPKPASIQVSLALLDELGIPFDKYALVHDLTPGVDFEELSNKLGNLLATTTREVLENSKA